MYILDGIAYADDPRPLMKVCGVRPMDEHRLWVRFTTGEAKVFDLKPYLHLPAFAPLTDEALFRQVYIDHGVTVWRDGEIDIDPEWMYEEGTTVN